LEHLYTQVTVVTQNVDGLHQAAGSTDVVELHGSIRRYKCLDGGHGSFTRDDFAEQTAIPPRCPQCNDLLRPDVVWFGELLPQTALARATALCESCDAMLVVGTSGAVYPAATLPFLAVRAGALIVDVNPRRDEFAHLTDMFLQGPGGIILPALMAALETTRRNANA
jgi:NAD-dependent deacetylase